MNVIEELQALRSSATTDHVKQLLDAEIVKVKVEAQTAVQAVEAHISGEVKVEESKLKELWEHIKKALTL